MPTPKTLRAQLQEQSLHLQLLDQQQHMLNRVISKIRASLDLETIFRTAAKETCKLLQVERVAVYRFCDDWGGEFVSEFEFAEPGWNALEALSKNTVWNDSYLQEHQGGRYRDNQPLVVTDVYQADLSQCHLDILAQFHIRAYATVPIFIGQRLWGVLAAYQHSKPYEWQDTQVQFLMQVAAHLGVAVKQAELLAQAEQKAEELQMVQVAQAAQSVVKRPSDLLARYGGEEFAVILPDTDQAGATQIAQEIQQAIADLKILHRNLGGEQRFVTISLGVASTIPSKSMSMMTLIDEADKALYQAKEQGRNRVVCQPLL